MKITIRRDDALEGLSSLTKKDKIELAHHIIEQAIQAKVITNDKEYCGANLFEIFFDYGYNLIAATLFCLGKCDPFLMDKFRNLVIWGIYDDCPDCGWETDFITGDCYKGHLWEERKCTNCGKVVSNEPDWDVVPGGYDYNN
jgi:hypothetical protein